MPDQREAIVINKLALEYRKMRQEESGIVVAHPSDSRHLNEQRQDERVNGKALQKHIHRAEKDKMQVGMKNSTTMMKHFRI